MINSSAKSASDERRKALLAWLSPLSFQKIHDRILAASMEETGQWLLCHEIYLSWKERSHRALLWIYGKHGSGKSHLAARIIEELTLLCYERKHTAGHRYSENRGHDRPLHTNAAQEDASITGFAEPQNTLVPSLRCSRGRERCWELCKIHYFIGGYGVEKIFKGLPRGFSEYQPDGGRVRVLQF